MSARACLAALVLATSGLAAGPVGPPRADGPEALVGEWTLRRRAVEAERDAPAVVAELVAELAHERWSVRARALDGFARLSLALDADALAAVAGRLDDAHPNVRARALAALRRAGAGEVGAARAAALARDALPEVRLELARLAGGGAVEDGDARLLELAFDGDARVAAAARAALVQRGRAVLPLLERLEALPDAWLEVVRTCARTRAWPVGEGSAAPLLTAELNARGEPVHDGMRDTARAAVVAALAFARGEAGDVDALAAGWLAPLGVGPTAAERRSSADVLLEARRRDLLLRAAPEAGDPLGSALLARLVAGGADDDTRAFLLEGTLQASSVEALVRGALPLDAGTALELWRRLALRDARLEPDVLARWLAPERPPELRAAVAETLELALRRGDGAPGQVLAALLDDPDARVRRIAFRALANAPDARPWLDDLFRAWSRLPTDEALHLCDELPRDHAPRPFRAALLALGEAARARAAGGAPEPRSSSVIELLGLFDGDAEVIAALARWLASDLDRLSAPGGVEPGLEVRARGLVLALARAADASTAETVERALDVALAETAPVSIEVAKVVAAALGRTRGGRERLEAWLAPDVPTRVRIEAALARAAPGAPHDERALAVLLESFEACDGELRRRILTRLGELDDPRAVALAAGVASGPYPLEEVALALATLGARAPAPDVVDALRRATLEAPELETRRRAIEAAGAVGGAELAALLEEAWWRWIEPPDPAAAEALSPEVRDLLREELLLASARAGSAWPRVERELFARAIASAEDDLERRFAGTAGPATEFAYRSELALCEALADAGRLAAALDAADGWWRIDARLALALGERALERAAELPDERARATRAAAARLLRLAAIGLEGEPPDEDWAVLATQARLAWMQVAREAGDWRSASFAARELVRVWRADELGERTWLRVLGAADPRAGIDPRGFLEATLAQLEAHEALAAGEREAARRHAQRAAALVGRSRRAAAAQARLELLLAGAPTVVPDDPRD